jgi:tetratricopeptide (TPR) repeat protein
MAGMPRPLVFLVLTLAVLGFAGSSFGAEESAGARDLARGREHLARRDYPAAVEHLKSAVRGLDPTRDAAALGDAWLQLGIAYLNGLGQPEEALPAFLASAATSPEPSTAWLWASVTAENLGRREEAIAYRTRAVARPAAAPAPPSASAPPMQELAPEPQPAPVEAAPSEQPDAIQHFFGPETAEVKKEEAAPEAKPGPQDRAQEKAKEKKVDAFEHFFGEKKETPPEENEKPPRI